MYFDVDDELKLALKTEALLAETTVSKLVEKALREKFAHAIQQARKAIADHRPKGKQKD